MSQHCVSAHFYCDLVRGFLKHMAFSIHPNIPPLPPYTYYPRGGEGVSLREEEEEKEREKGGDSKKRDIKMTAWAKRRPY